MMNPLVSVILPNHNHASYITDSIEAILRQSYANLELLVVDDCSSDNSRECIETFTKKDARVSSIYNSRNKGVSYARNIAIEGSSGKYLAFCDADDIWERRKLEMQVDAIEGEQKYDVTFCDSMIIDEHGIMTGHTFSSTYGKIKKNEKNIFRRLCKSNFINLSTVVIKKSCIEKVGLFEESLRYLQDWFYWVALARHFNFLYLDMILAKYRVHSRSTFFVDKSGYCKERLETYQMIVDRYPDLQNDVKSSLYYNMARQHAYLGDKNAARENYVASLKHSKMNVKSLVRMLIG